MQHTEGYGSHRGGGGFVATAETTNPKAHVASPTVTSHALTVPPVWSDQTYCDKDHIPFVGLLYTWASPDRGMPQHGKCYGAENAVASSSTETRAGISSDVLAAGVAARSLPSDFNIRTKICSTVPTRIIRSSVIDQFST